MGSNPSKTHPAEQGLETHSFVWLDSSNKNRDDARRHRDALQSINDHVSMFADGTKCEQHLRSTKKDEQIILIVSERLGRQIVPRVHALPPLVSIYVLCPNREANREWIQPYDKIRGLFITLPELINQIQIDHRQEQMFISIFDSKIVHQKLTQDLNGQFVHLPFLINKLLQGSSDVMDRAPLIKQCRRLYRENEQESKMIRRFRKHYSPESAISWYLKDTFLTRVLNRALAQQDIRQLSLFQFFLVDLQNQLEQRRCSSSIRVYKCQFLSNEQWASLEKSSGQFISINSFLCAELDRKRAHQSLKRPIGDLKRVLFKIDADPTLEFVRPFGRVRSSTGLQRRRVLFMLGSIFQIVGISRQRHDIAVVRLKLCTDHCQQLNHLSKADNCLAFGHALMTIGKLDEAEKFYQSLLNKYPRRLSVHARCYQTLAVIRDEQADYLGTRQYFQKALDIHLNEARRKEPEIASIYNSLAEIYRKEGDFVNAHKYFDCARKIWERDRSTRDLFKLAVCYNNIGIVCQEEKKYKKALDFYRKAYDIRTKHCAFDLISIGISYNNIGGAYYRLNQFQDAFHAYEEALKTYEKCLPFQHPKIASTYNNIGGIYEQRGDVEDALSYYNRAADIYRSIYPATHPNLIKIEMNIDRVSAMLKCRTATFSLENEIKLEFQ